MTSKSFLYHAGGHDRDVPLMDFDPGSLTDQQLLWIDVCGESDENAAAIERLQIDAAALRRLKDSHRPNFLDKYNSYFAFRVETPAARQGQDTCRSKPQRVGFIVGVRWLVTLHDADVPFLTAFRAQDKGETNIGALTPPLLAVSLLDWYLGEFFAAASLIAADVDGLDERILASGADRPLLNEIVAARRRVSELRALIARQRPVFHGLTRPDFAPDAGESVIAQFSALADRFDRAVDDVERSRDVVVGSFDLFTSMSSEETNDLVKALTLLTAILGFSAAVSGLLGMNFDVPFFHTGMTGFVVTTASVVAVSIIAVVVAKLRKWI